MPMGSRPGPPSILGLLHDFNNPGLPEVWERPVNVLYLVSVPAAPLILSHSKAFLSAPLRGSGPVTGFVASRLVYCP